MAGSGTGYREDVVAVSCVTKIEREKGTGRERERKREREREREGGEKEWTSASDRKRKSEERRDGFKAFRSFCRRRRGRSSFEEQFSYDEWTE